MIESLFHDIQAHDLMSHNFSGFEIKTYFESTSVLGQCHD